MRTLRLSLAGTVLLALLVGLGSLAPAQATADESPAPLIDGQTIAEMVNEAINTGDPAIRTATPSWASCGSATARSSAKSTRTRTTTDPSKTAGNPIAPPRPPAVCWLDARETILRSGRH